MSPESTRQAGWLRALELRFRACTVSVLIQAISEASRMTDPDHKRRFVDCPPDIGHLEGSASLVG
jgi:hypothetical protein